MPSAHPYDDHRPHRGCGGPRHLHLTPDTRNGPWDDRWDGPTTNVDWDELTDALCHVVALAYEHGWQPADLVWAMRRDPFAALLVRLAVLAEAEGSAPPGRWTPWGWRRQLDAVARHLDAARHPHQSWSGADHGRDQLREHLQDSRDDLGAERVLESLLRLRKMPRLVPPPSAWQLWAGPDDVAASNVPPELLARVRALLAKAESTDHPPEAEAFSAKAQELIARHAIDDALLAGERPDDGAVGRRIHIERPYVRPKCSLLAQVAGANRCRTVIDTELELVTTFGHPADVDAVELLFTSLLVQATNAVLAAGGDATVGHHRRSRGYRSAFLAAYATRIGQRLHHAQHRATTDPRCTAALPVLARRESAAARAVDEHFPETARFRVQADDPLGRAHGRAAADRADLHAADRLQRGGRQRLPPGSPQ